MASGVPCVVTNVGDSAFLVGDTGRVVPPRAPADLGTAIAELLALEPGARRSLGRQARGRIDDHFRLETAVERYQDLHRELARRPRRRDR
jgi:glycosyltransferase involved in cell wall biosynthesis